MFDPVAKAIDWLTMLVTISLAVIVPPTCKFLAIPTPPVTVSAPVEVEVDSVEDSTCQLVPSCLSAFDTLVLYSLKLLLPFIMVAVELLSSSFKRI